MGAAGGTMYSGSFTNLVCRAVTQDLIQLFTTTAADQTAIIHSWRLSFVPLQASGVAQADYANLQIVRRTTVSSSSLFGAPIQIAGVPLDKTAPGALTNMQLGLESVGTLDSVVDSFTVPIIYPFYLKYRDDQRLPMIAQYNWPTNTFTTALYLSSALSVPYLVSGEVIWEEISP
jgi:hypothetical protein